jgi:hypothetical protein
MRCKELQFFRVQLLKELEALDHPHSLAEMPTLEEGTQDILDQANAEHEKSFFFHFLERQGYAVQEIGQASKGIGMFFARYDQYISKEKRMHPVLMVSRRDRSVGESDRRSERSLEKGILIRRRLKE